MTGDPVMGLPVSPDPDALVRRELGQLFTVERALHHGPLASVYVARETKSGAMVALKTIVRLPSLEPESEGRFRRQAAGAARLDHPHIIPVRRYGVSPSFLWYSMHYCPAGAVRTVPPMAVIDCISAVQQIASALDYAHGRGTVHADLRPANVLLDASGLIRLSDFGILHALGGVAALETVQFPPGALDYLAPEQLVKNGVPGPAADQYALGVLAYEYLAGLPLFGATSAEDLAERRRAGPPPDLTALRPDVPSRLAEAVRRALSDAPGDRFASVAEFVGALTSPAVPVVLLPEEATSDDDDGPLPVLRPRGRPWWIMGVASAVLLVAAGSLWFASTSRSPTESAVVSPVPVAPPEQPSLNVERPPPAAADPSAAPRPLPPAQVVVSSMPWAELYVDGRLVGNTPVVDLRLPAGQHRLRLERVGFRPHEQVVNLAPGQRLRITGIVLQQETAP
ncbi:MAG: serine/threonine-protein kinase [Gemmatimonadota bacterium]